MAGVEMEIVQQLLENPDMVVNTVENMTEYAESHPYISGGVAAFFGVSAIGTAVNYGVTKYAKELEESRNPEEDGYTDGLDD